MTQSPFHLPDDAKMDELRTWVTKTIAAHRRAVIAVSDVMPFAYTVGNSEHHLPEFILFGMAGQDARGLLNHLSITLRNQPTPKNGALISLQKGMLPLKLVDTSAPETKGVMNAVRMHYGKDHAFRAMQVVIPDQKGRFPGDPGCADPYSRIKVYADA